MSYDQWKTASPYDDEPDFIEEAEKWIDRNNNLDDVSPDQVTGEHREMTEAYWIMKGLLQYLEDC